MLVGVAAASFPDGGAGRCSPTPAEAAAFLAYNARCDVDLLPLVEPADGSALSELERRGEDYLALRW